MNAPLFVNPNRLPLDETYMQMAEIWAKRSKANRLQVGALIVKDQQIISDGYNGMPSGVENDVCEYWHPDDGQFVLRTKPEVLHAESNALLKISKNGGTGAEGGTLYTTYSPCPECAKLIKQSRIARVVYRNQYRLLDGIVLLRKLGVTVDQLTSDGETAMEQQVRQHVYAPQAPAPIHVAPPAPRQHAPIIPRSEPTPAAPPGPVPAPVEIIPPRGGPTVEEEAEVAALLAAWEASQASQGAAPAKKDTQRGPDDGRYRSTFS